MAALNDYGKLILLLAALAATLVAALAGVIDGDTFEKLLILEVGYVIGNGVNAVRRQPPSPVLVPRLERQDPDTEGG